MLLQRFSISSCCLCGSSEKLTGEHKIKASALRKEFGKGALAIGDLDFKEAKMKFAQSAKSKYLKFSVLLCEVCNTARTQQADREFDFFHQLALERVQGNQDPLSIFGLERYAEGSEPYLNVFRYFAKLLSCHIAEVNAPIPVTLAEFAIGRLSHNRVWLKVKSDPTYRHANEYLGVDQYASHGGLIVYGDKKTNEPNAFHSTITLGPIQYVFYTRLNVMEKMELRKKYPDFLKWCMSIVADARESPIPEHKLLQLGLQTKCDGGIKN